MTLEDILSYGLLTFITPAFVVLLLLYLKQRKRLLREIKHAQKNDELRSSYLSHIIRALRLPLKTIDRVCDELEEPRQEKLPEEERQKMISNIHLNSHQMFIYMDELLELTNFDGAVPAFSTIEVNIIELVMSYRREIMHEANSGVLVCVRTNMSPHCKATLNTTLFRQLMIHLLRIAARRTQEGSITIRYEWEKEGLRFWIEDTGAPIPDNVKQTLFTNIPSEEDIVKLENKSTFISLSICKTIVKSMEGTIEVLSSNSEFETDTTTISFWIPCYVRFN